MGEQLTVEIEKNLKEVLLRYCEAVRESPSAIVDRALRDFMAQARSKGGGEWFGLSVEDYLTLSEEERETLWNKAYGIELERHQLPEKEVRPRAVTPRQRGRETLCRRLREIREKPAAHS
jgi:predicted transcriptional regulator